MRRLRASQESKIGEQELRAIHQPIDTIAPTSASAALFGRISRRHSNHVVVNLHIHIRSSSANEPSNLLNRRVARSHSEAARIIDQDYLPLIFATEYLIQLAQNWGGATCPLEVLPSE